MTDDFSITERLRYEHLKAIHELQLKRDKWEKLKKDYEELREKLIRLPLKLKHEHKVPIGSVGLFEGNLIHTNEIMVLLGDNWFTQCTAHQATEIINHRIQVVEKNLKEVHEEITFLESRKQGTEKLSEMDKAEGIVDIQEENKDVKTKPTGKRWVAHKASHSMKPRSVKELDKEKKEENKKEAKKNTNGKEENSVEKLFARLDELEMEEKMTALKEHEIKIEELNSGKTNHVRFKDNEEAEEKVLNGEENLVVNKGENCIRFKHTNHNGETFNDKDVSSLKSTFLGNSDQTFVSPADIYAHFMKPQSADVDEKPLKSILKKERKYSNEGMKPKPILKHSPEHKSDGSSGDELTVTPTTEDPKPILKTGAEALSGTVIERDVSTAVNKPDSEVPKKKSVSRFKASRMKK